MAITKKERYRYQMKRDRMEEKDWKEEKIDKKLREAFQRLNRRDFYEFYTDPDTRSYENFLNFLTILTKKLENFYGKKKKYKKDEVQELLETFFQGISERGCKTMKAMDKALKKTDDPDLCSFPFNGLMKSKIFHSYNHSSSVDQSYSLEDSFNQGGFGYDY